MKTLYFCILFLLQASRCFTQETGICNRYSETIQLYNENSIQPIDPNKIDQKKFSEQIITWLDPDYVIFTTSDCDSLKAIGEALKNNLMNAFCLEKNKLIEVYTNSLKRSLLILDELKGQFFDYSQPDSLYIGTQFNYQYYLRNSNLRWTAWIKSKVLEDVMAPIAKFDSLKQSDILLKNYLNNKKIKVILHKEKQLNALLNPAEGLEQYLSDVYTNSLLNQFDTYSNVFTKESFLDFRQELSTYTKSFGIQFERNNGQTVKVSSVIPGSYAWKTGVIHAGDNVLRIKSGQQEALILKNASAKEIAEYLSSNNREITLTISDKVEGQKDITLIQEDLEHIENAVQAFILNGDIKVGYILLPAFYTSWDENTHNGCSLDVGRAIYSLRKEKIDALIIDMRDNGGGSIFEAIDLAGLFIDFGTFLISQDSKNMLTPLKDFNRGTMYSAPLAVLINSFSASASEMVAAILQDYNRAIIIGDTSYGKACGQSVLPVGNGQNALLKVTTNHFFRVNGNSYNGTGIIPDISLPDIQYPMDENEDYQKSVLPNKPIDKKTYFTPLPSLPIDSLKHYSGIRVAENNKFREIKEINGLLNTPLFKKNLIYLDLNRSYERMQQYETIYSKLDTLHNGLSSKFNITYLENDSEMSNLYKYYANLLSQLALSVGSDPVIEEAYNILYDNKIQNTLNK